VAGCAASTRARPRTGALPVDMDKGGAPSVAESWEVCAEGLGEGPEVCRGVHGEVAVFVARLAGGGGRPVFRSVVVGVGTVAWGEGLVGRDRPPIGGGTGGGGIGSGAGRRRRRSSHRVWASMALCMRRRRLGLRVGLGAVGEGRMRFLGELCASCVAARAVTTLTVGEAQGSMCGPACPVIPSSQSQEARGRRGRRGSPGSSGASAGRQGKRRVRQARCLGTWVCGERACGSRQTWRRGVRLCGGLWRAVVGATWVFVSAIAGGRRPRDPQAPYTTAPQPSPLRQPSPRHTRACSLTRGVRSATLSAPAREPSLQPCGHTLSCSLRCSPRQARYTCSSAAMCQLGPRWRRPRPRDPRGRHPSAGPAPSPGPHLPPATAPHLHHQLCPQACLQNHPARPRAAATRAQVRATHPTIASTRSRAAPRPPRSPPCCFLPPYPTGRPNFLIILVDDQDTLLNSTHRAYMPYLNSLIAEQVRTRRAPPRLALPPQHHSRTSPKCQLTTLIAAAAARSPASAAGPAGVAMLQRSSFRRPSPARVTLASAAQRPTRAPHIHQNFTPHVPPSTTHPTGPADAQLRGVVLALLPYARIAAHG
jgi:hypothetical protein